jgi:hypothetical protein
MINEVPGNGFPSSCPVIMKFSVHKGTNTTGTASQSDGAPPHFSHPVRAFLDGEFPDLWIGTGGPILRPPHSPAMTSLVLFWEFVKGIVCLEKVKM